MPRLPVSIHFSFFMLMMRSASPTLPITLRSRWCFLRTLSAWTAMLSSRRPATERERARLELFASPRTPILERERLSLADFFSSGVMSALRFFWLDERGVLEPSSSVSIPRLGERPRGAGERPRLRTFCRSASPVSTPTDLRCFCSPCTVISRRITLVRPTMGRLGPLSSRCLLTISRFLCLMRSASACVSTPSSSSSDAPPSSAASSMSRSSSASSAASLASMSASTKSAMFLPSMISGITSNFQSSFLRSQ
mmetsp:Transcript_42515/g.104704  ORF Transcript_42515/g.104704 Transcript_42515/m.104704 type:complete len:253 (-) Transcript_42515:1312-2070(-)